MPPSSRLRGGGSVSRGGRCLVLAALIAAVAIAGSAGVAGATAFVVPPPAPPLPPPSGPVVDVSTEAALQAALASLTSNTTIRVAPGTYALTSPLRIRNGVSNVAIRGATARRDDVVLRGTGMNVPGVDFGISVEDATDVTIADLSIGDVFYHPIQLHGELGCDRVRIYDVRLFDAGEQFLKASVDFANPNGVDQGTVEYCVIEYTTIGPADGYTNGVDVHDGSGWVIRHNLFRNIRVPPGTGYPPAVLVWSGSQGTITEANTFIDCARAIAYGLGPQTGFTHSHQGGRIANNFVYRSAAVSGDVGISAWDSPDTQIFHNTVFQNGTYPDSIEYRFSSTTGVVVENNLSDGAIHARDGATATVAGNLTSATAAYFVDASIGDLHLVPGGSPAFDSAGAVAAPVADDWDGDPRPEGPAPDVGADEARFLDVPPASPFFPFTMRLLRHGVVAGCGGGDYCPGDPVTRGQMGVLLLRSSDGAAYVPPPCVTPVFADVPCASPFAAWVDQLVARNVTAGCRGSLYCPLDPVTRAQMAVFLLKTHDGPAYLPPACAAPDFSDVPCSSPYAPWIGELASRGITTGCGGGRYCPGAAVTRAQIAVFLSVTFSLS